MAKENRRKQRAKRTNQPDLSKNALWAAAIFAALGAALAFYATNLTFSIESQGLVEASGCSLNDWINCDIANASSYAKMFGIPVAWWGFLFYAFSGLAALYGATIENRSSTAPFVAAAFILSMGAVLFTFVKAYHLYSLGVLCIVCIGMYVANFGTAISLGLALGYSPLKWGGLIGAWIAGVRGQEEQLKFSPQLVKVGITVAVVFGIGYAGALNHQRALTGTVGFDMDVALNAHFRQQQIQVDTHPEAAVWGNPESAVEVVEFADFQCPACRDSAFHLRPTLFEYQDDVKMTFMNYPLDSSINSSMQSQLHAQAGNAAKAGVCATEFGDFWNYHDELFRNQVTLSPQLYMSIAEDMGWDREAFATCMVRPDVHQRVLDDLEYGRATQLSSTPTVFINGRKVTYWRNTDFIRAVVQEELSRL
ncbi:MAG: thioredoxin domain-containing protein [Bacteroidetes Order II. Incertae sedis bacterium]|jgi:protein-disulfide isomerase/uncharacterized membrane protein|nr:thioredoxin domain-containing protein [Bacteroidetes Order II. bacterium]MBT4602032.1 thioredoxin domain-containing protein [Bacteroidetes Order II. bacterium]MBT6201392.1 thioredoxin domain-containing protein [Bacteroidetes Order II. bacterium]MBT7400184.1 thioredoxin domain-containing protein [Bacteroidetes Order II. bacterium]